MKRTTITFLKMMQSYLSILIIPLAAIIIIYCTTTVAIERNAKKQAEIALTSLRDTMDIRLKELKSVFLTVSENENILPLLSSGKINYTTSDKIYNIYHLAKTLPNYSLSNTIIDKLYIVLSDGEYVIGSNTATPYTERFYPLSFPYLSMSYQEMNQLLFTTRSVDRFIVLPDEGGKSSQILFLNTLAASSSSNKNCVVMKLSNKIVQDALKPLDPAQNGMALILDAEGHVIASHVGDDCQLNYEDTVSMIRADSEDPDIARYIVTSSESLENHWRYVLITPLKELLAPTQYVKYVIVVLMLISLLLGLLLAYFMTRNKAMALSKVLSSLDTRYAKPEARVERNEYRYLERAVDVLLKDNENLSESIENQKIMIQTSNVRRLLEGDYYGEEDLQRLIDSVNIIGLCEPFFVVMILRIRSSRIILENKWIEDIGFVRMCVKTVLSEELPDTFYCFDIDEENLAVLLPYEKSDVNFPEELDQAIERMYQKLKIQYHIETAFSISNPYSGEDQMHYAYEEAQQIDSYLHPRYTEHKKYKKDIPERQEYFYYSLERELQLMHEFKKGTVEGLSEVLDAIYIENMVAHHLSYSVVLELVSAVRNTILRGMQGAMSREERANLAQQLNASTLEDLFQLILSSKEQYAERKAAQSEEKDRKLKDRIEEYMDLHYQDSDASIHDLSSSIGMSETAIYQFFRDHMACTFADMLEHKRIQEACKLLVRKEYQIKEIAAMAGYSSDTSFRRAFKRVMGVSPGEYSQ